MFALALPEADCSRWRLLPGWRLRELLSSSLLMSGIVARASISGKLNLSRIFLVERLVNMGRRAPIHCAMASRIINQHMDGVASGLCRGWSSLW